MGKIVHLFRAPKRRAAMEELESVEVIENAGFAGCAHARPNGRRQVLMVDEDTLNAFQLQPGIIRENITTSGIDVNALRVGQILKVGEVELEVSLACEPCEQLELVRPGLMAAMEGRRGTLCRVKRGGTLHRGDEITVGTAVADEVRADS